MTRTISQSLAPIVAELELDQPVVVTMSDLAELVTTHQIRTAPKMVAARLRQQGWLLATATPGVWEFAPAAHANPIGHGDPFIELRAVLATHPKMNAAVSGTSALWAQGLIDRAPDGLDVSMPPNDYVPKSFARIAHVSRFTSRLQPVHRKKIPLQRVATTLVHAATRPRAIRSWSAVGDRLVDIFLAADQVELRVELVDRPHATLARLAYLIFGVAPEIADEIFPKSQDGRTHPIIWFGPRRSGLNARYSRRFGIVDTLLPFDPADIHINL